MGFVVRVAACSLVALMAACSGASSAFFARSEAGDGGDGGDRGGDASGEGMDAENGSTESEAAAGATVSAGEGGVAASGVADASVADASVADASVADASVADASVADASVADASEPPDGNADATLACNSMTCSQGCCSSTGVCEPGTASGACGSGGAACGACVATSCETPGAGTANCGAASESCCTSPLVTGGTFDRTFSNAGAGATDLADPATVSSFRLDKYFVTVGRFRSFVAAWNGGIGWLPAAGSGKHAHLNGGQGLNATGGGYEPGWVATDDPNLAPTNANLACIGNSEPNLAAGSTYGTWTPSPGGQENLPINCVNWYEAYAFCIWDKGFLPSEAEWEYAAVGGNQERNYPWGSAAPAKDSQYAIYACFYPAGSTTCSGSGNIAPVGTAQLGVGLWGQLDLAGTLWEWTLDWHANFVNPCTDCANFTAGTQRSDQGGNFNTGTGQFPPFRGANNPADTGAYAYGFRCARSP